MNRNFRNRLLFTFLFASLSLLTYGRSLNSEFLVDDHYYRNSRYLQTFSSWPEFFTASDSQHFSPIYDLLNVSLFRTLGEGPFPYRLFNVILFGLTCSALFFYLQRLGFSKQTSFLTGLLFLIHPVNAHCVNYITCNFIFLFALLLMAAHSSFLSFIERTENNRRFLVISLVCYGLSLLTFEGALLFPLYLANDLFIRKQMQPKRAFGYCSLFLIAAVVYLILWKCVTGTNSQVFPLLVSSLSHGTAILPAISYLVYWYIVHLFVPRGIVLIYSVQPPTTVEGPLGLIAALLLIGTVIFLLYALRRDRVKQFTLIWFLIGFLLLIPAAFAHYDLGLILEPHWFLFSSMGLFLLIALILSRGMSSLRHPWAGKVAVTVIVVYLFALTQRYNTMARTEESYCRHWLKISPGNNIALTNLANVSLEQGRYEDALTYYKRCLQPRLQEYRKNAIAYRGIARTYWKQNDMEQARIYYEKAVASNPKDAKSFNQLGVYFAEKEELNEAERYFLKSLELNPYLLPATKNLTNVYLSTDRIQDAVALYKDYMELPLITLKEKIDAHIALAILYQKTKQTDESFSHMSETIKLDPSGKSYFKLCETLYAAGFQRLAEALLKNYIGYFRPLPQAYLLYGTLLGNRMKYRQAIEMWKKGLDLDPSDERFKQNIETAQRLMADAAK